MKEEGERDGGEEKQMRKRLEMRERNTQEHKDMKGIQETESSEKEMEHEGKKER